MFVAAQQSPEPEYPDPPRHSTTVGLLGPSPSLLPALARIVEMAKLPANRDGEDADPPTASAVAAACYLIAAVAERQPRRSSGSVLPAMSSPIPDGGLQLEWKSP